ncbi:CRISPR-associated DxTHG motif protein [Vulcanisaeta distributa]|uniref:CRISPR-associated DxTHG motif protein n=1 Tax=Vulcanisaeta distributa TaxID=164451 RepID=UPI0006D06048|nr:CRISPR-associated DxTHG motif protein [Vulcanisaeta distributa]
MVRGGYIECIVKELLGDARNVKVVVTSVKGRLGDWEFTGKSNPDLIASELLIELWRYIKDLITDDVDLHLFLDVTHGINFMPTLTYQITRYIATLALIKGAGNTYIRVYNALPGSSEDSFEVVKLINDSIKRLVLPQDTRSTIVKALTYGGALATIPKILSKEHVCDKNCDKDYDNFQVNAKINHGGDKKVEYEFKGGIKPNDVYSRLIEKLLCEDKVFSQAVEKGGVR